MADEITGLSEYKVSGALKKVQRGDRYRLRTDHGNKDQGSLQVAPNGYPPGDPRASEGELVTHPSWLQAGQIGTVREVVPADVTGTPFEEDSVVLEFALEHGHGVRAVSFLESQISDLLEEVD